MFSYRKQENMKNVAEEDDYIKAADYAMDQMCIHKGYRVVHVPAGSMVDEYDPDTKTITKVVLEEGRNECRHTEQSCKAASKFPSTEDEMYLEWKDGNCIMGNEAFREFCKSKKLDYD